MKRVYVYAKKAMTKAPVTHDFRSDTVTVPTSQMLQSVLSAEVGDDVFNDDTTTNALQDRICKLTGKEAALFMPSGTMANQVSIRAQLSQPPCSLICDRDAHIFSHEAGALGMLTQALTTPISPSNGLYLTLNDIIPHVIVGDEIHGAPTCMICLENTINGVVMPIDDIKEISAYARAGNIKIHLDGARLWNASAETGISIQEYCSLFDSVSLCLSKGIGAPIGSIIVGSKEFIAKAKWFRKAYGGGMRQTGVLTSMANTALDSILPKLKKTHTRARYLADECEKLGIKVTYPVDTNMVWLDLANAQIDEQTLVASAKQRGIAILGGRIVIHHQITQEAINLLIEVLRESCK